MSVPDDIFDIEIDKRVALGIAPKKIKADPGLVKELDELCTRRWIQWQSYIYIKNDPMFIPMLESFMGKLVVLDGITCKEKQGAMDYIYINDDLIMQFVILETKHPAPDDPLAYLGPETVVLRGQCCYVHTGELFHHRHAAL